MRLFITGATGFVGSHLVRRLAQTEHDLYCLVRETSDVGELETLGATLFTGDVTDRDTLPGGMEGSDCVINLANVYSFWEPDKQVFAEVNVEGTRNVMECALELEIPKVVHVSSVVTFGRPDEVPFNEETPVGPERFSEYARTKYGGDLIAWDLYEEQGLPLVMIYPAPVLGPGDTKSTGSYINRLICGKTPAQALCDSLCTFVHVKDVAEAILRAAEKEDNIGEKYLVCAELLTVAEFNKVICEAAGTCPPKLSLPDWMAMMNATLLTGIADVVKKPPLWGMAVDYMKTTKHGFSADGTKAARELGIDYTPVRVAIQESVVECQAKSDFFHWTGPTAKGVDVGSARVDLPIMYYRDDCFLGFFSAACEPVRALLPCSEMYPVTLPNGRAVVGVTAFNYLETSIGPYGEIAIFIPSTYGRQGPPLLPLLREGKYPGWGTFVLHLPVTNIQARDAGRVIFGYGKFVADMDFERHPIHQRVRLSEGDRHILTLTVQQQGRTQKDNRPIITYSVLDGELLKTTIPSCAVYQMGMGSGLGTLALGDHEIGDQLRSLDISPTAFSTRNYLSRCSILPAGETVGRADRPYHGYPGEDREYGRLTMNYDYAGETRDVYAGLRARSHPPELETIDMEQVAEA